MLVLLFFFLFVLICVPLFEWLTWMIVYSRENTAGHLLRFIFFLPHIIYIHKRWVNICMSVYSQLLVNCDAKSF